MMVVQRTNVHKPHNTRLYEEPCQP